MAWPSPYPMEQHDAVEAMLREGSLTILEIVARTRLPRSTVYGWSTRLRRRAGKVVKRARLNPESWSMTRRKAVIRLFTTAEVDPCVVAQALGGPRHAAQDLRRALGLKPRRGLIENVPGIEALDRDLRIQIGRQIAALGKRLKAAEPGLDAGKALRDLGGLKRLLEDLADKARNRGDGEADGEPEEDLGALRDRIARRCAAIMESRQTVTAGSGTDAGSPQGAGS